MERLGDYMRRVGLEGLGLAPPEEDAADALGEPSYTAVVRGPWTGQLLGPGERVVGEQVLYSAAWLDD